VTKPGPSATRSEPGDRRPDGSATRVLVIDDEPSLAGLMTSALRYEGWDAETAADGLSAMRAGREFRPDAVVPDVMLPDFGGLEVLRRLRAEPPAGCACYSSPPGIPVEDRIAGITAPGPAARQAPGRMIYPEEASVVREPVHDRANERISASVPPPLIRLAGQA
jgi:two-component system, OmpR family, response regulator